MKKSIAAFLLLICTGCQTAPHEKFAEVHEGLKKGQVLAILGDPDHRYRKNDTDRWVYRFEEGQNAGEFVEKEVWFQNGRVVYRDDNAAAVKTKKKPTSADFEPVE